LQRQHLLCPDQAVSQGNFDLHVLARLQAGDGLIGVHLGGGAEDDRVQLWDRQAVGQIGGDVANAVFRRDFLRLVDVTADDGNNFHAGDIFDAVQVFDAEGTCARQGDFDGFAHVFFLLKSSQVFSSLLNFPKSNGPPRCCWPGRDGSGGFLWA
jgi:hypothetical protein